MNQKVRLRSSIFLIVFILLTVKVNGDVENNGFGNKVCEDGKMTRNEATSEAEAGSGHCVDRDGKLPRENEPIRNRYLKEEGNREWKNIRKLIQDAENGYKESKDAEPKCGKESCACYSLAIDNDLKPFLEGITGEMIQKTLPRGVLYQIINHKLYRHKDCKFPARCAGIEHFLQEIIYDLPNMEFVINVSDYPQVSKWVQKPISPVFSFSKTDEFLDITYPAWSFWEGGPSISIFPAGLGRWDLLRKSLLKAAKQNPWVEKKSQAFFRGSRTSAERDSLILLSRSNPNLVDAQYTKNQAWKSDADTLGAPAASEVSLEAHCSYKYLFNFRGVGASFRFKHLFLCGSLVLHVGDEWKEFFYYRLKPWIHYIPVNKNSTVTELRSLIEFVQFHDELSQKIANQGLAFIKYNLRMSHVSCYWKELLTKYAKLIKHKIVPGKNLIAITRR